MLIAFFVVSKNRQKKLTILAPKSLKIDFLLELKKIIRNIMPNTQIVAFPFHHIFFSRLSCFLCNFACKIA